jgi:hypothetical protein
MKTEHSRTVQPMPTVTNLARAMRLLGVPGDPMYLMKDHTDTRCRTEILARIAAWSLLLLQQAESQAEFSTDDVVDLHWAADLAVTPPSGRSSDAVPALDLQIARLAWAHHMISRTGHGSSSKPHDPAATVISAVVQLLEARRDSSVGVPVRAGPPGYVDPQVTDGLRALEEAADRIARLVRRQYRAS